MPAGQSQAEDLKAALDLLFNHPNTGPFIARRLIQRLVTSNPSPGYIARVAQAFANNGRGVRGDMKAVIQAILLDSEARLSNPAGYPGYGHEREPIIRLANLYRAFNASSASGKFVINNQPFIFGQAPLYSPTVFNFFAPDYSQPGPIEEAGLFAPEFQITTDTTVDYFRQQNAKRCLPAGFRQQSGRDCSESLFPYVSRLQSGSAGRFTQRSADERRHVDSDPQYRRKRRRPDPGHERTGAGPNRGSSRWLRHRNSSSKNNCTIMEISRRHFIRQAACAAVGTTSIASTVWNLRAINAATAQAISGGGEFRALVCLFLYGGNDANNMIVPNDDGAYTAYAAARGPLALAQTSLLPLNLITPDPQGRTFALHPSMPELQALFNPSGPSP